VRERDGTVAKELGLYKGKSSRAWDDELLVGDNLSSQEHVVDSLLRDATARVSEDAEVIPEADVVPVERPVERESEADKKGDVKRLDRAMDRTLYLVVKGKDGWGFPADRLLSEGETLHVVSLCRHWRGYRLLY
jgi:large subunit ribosomal protein L46